MEEKVGGTTKRNATVLLLLLFLCGGVSFLVVRSPFGAGVGNVSGSLVGSQQTTTQQRLGQSAQMNTTTTNTSTLAYAHSFGMFDDVPDQEWELLRNRTLSSSWYANPDEPLEGVDDAPRWNKMNMNSTFDCPRMEGVGEGGQRTKLVCNPKRLAHRKNDSGVSDCLIYSVGSAGDFKFEDDVARMHSNKCEIHVFDPADWSRQGDALEKNIHYHAWGLLSTYDDSKSVVWPKGRKGGFKTFPETLDILGHVGRTIDLFKIDCEGCEWSSINDWIHLGFRQILVETHGVPSPRGTPNARWYKKAMNVSEYYKAFSDHGYALYSKDLVGELAMELSFIKLHEDFWKGNPPSE